MNHGESLSPLVQAGDIIRWWHQIRHLARSSESLSPFVQAGDIIRYEMVSLSLHETNPGHHLQSSYSIEQSDWPMFRKVFILPVSKKFLNVIFFGHGNSKRLFCRFKRWFIIGFFKRWWRTEYTARHHRGSPSTLPMLRLANLIFHYIQISRIPMDLIAMNIRIV